MIRHVCGCSVRARADSVLGTDLGQAGNPTPVDGLQTFVTGLMAEASAAIRSNGRGREMPGALPMG